MNEITKPCPVKPGAGTSLIGFDECSGSRVVLSMDDLPNWPALATCDVVAACPVIAELKAKDVNLQTQINTNSTNITNLNNDITNIHVTLGNLSDADDALNNRIDEVNTNITILKGMNIRQEAKIKSLETKVTRDTTRLDFNEWVQEVYIPQCGLLDNKYKQGDFYINANQSVSATNATYINIRPASSTAPCSAADWQEIYYSSPADVLTVIGVDPIEIQHPYRNEWVVAVNPDKLEDFISKLSDLDLCDVNVKLGNVRGCGTPGNETTRFDDSITVGADAHIMGSTTINENLAVGNEATIKDLITSNTATLNGSTVMNGNIAIPGVITTGVNVIGDSEFHADVVIDGSLTVTNLIAKQEGSQTIDGALHVKGPTSLDGPINAGTGTSVDFISNVTMNGSLEVNDNTKTNSLTVTGTGTANNMHLTGSTKIDRVDGHIELSDGVTMGGPVDIDGSLTVEGPATMHDLHVLDMAHLPSSAAIFINGVALETYLLAFGSQHWQPK